MKYFEVISIVVAFSFLLFLIIVHINEIRKTRKMQAERKKCFSMISRCSQLLRIWETNVYMTDVDFNFLKHRIYKDYIHIHDLPFEVIYSEKERLILAEGFHWISASKEDRQAKFGKEIKPENIPSLFGRVLNVAVTGFAGFSKHKNIYDDLEWIYYMWLTEVFIHAKNSQKLIDREELKILCLKIEKWTANYNMDSRYLKDKINECREEISNNNETSVQPIIKQ